MLARSAQAAGFRCWQQFPFRSLDVGLGDEITARGLGAGACPLAQKEVPQDDGGHASPWKQGFQGHALPGSGVGERTLSSNIHRPMNVYTVS